MTAISLVKNIYMDNCNILLATEEVSILWSYLQHPNFKQVSSLLLQKMLQEKQYLQQLLKF